MVIKFCVLLKTTAALGPVLGFNVWEVEMKFFFSLFGLCGLGFIACVLELHFFMIESVSSLPSI